MHAHACCELFYRWLDICDVDLLLPTRQIQGVAYEMWSVTQYACRLPGLVSLCRFIWCDICTDQFCSFTENCWTLVKRSFMLCIVWHQRPVQRHWSVIVVVRRFWATVSAVSSRHECRQSTESCRTNDQLALDLEIGRNTQLACIGNVMRRPL